MEKVLKLSSKLSFRGWPPECVAQLLKLETDNEEMGTHIDWLLKQNEELKNALRKYTRERSPSIKTNSRQVGDDSQPLKQTTRIKSKAR